MLVDYRRKDSTLVTILVKKKCVCSSRYILRLHGFPLSEGRKKKPSMQTLFSNLKWSAGMSSVHR